MKNKLTNLEWNAISHLTRTTHLDDAFDIAFDENHDYFEDFENNCEMPLEEGLSLLHDCIAYPCQHDGLTVEEGELIADVLIECEIADTDWKTWFLSDPED